MTTDLLIVGAGPAGLASAYAAKRYGLSCLVLERGLIAQTVYDYPIGKPLHSPPEDVELLWGELYSHQLNATREEVLLHYNRFALQHQQLEIHTQENVVSLERSDNSFIVRTDKGVYAAKHVILATGGFGIPRKLNVPGETSERVSYRFTEGYPYAGKEVLVVGGGNSAAEASLYLHEASAKVTLSLRRPSFLPLNASQDLYTVVKPWIRAPLEAYGASGQIRILYSSRVIEVTKDAAIMKIEGQEDSTQIPCRHIFALIGADPDLTLLHQVGADIASDGRPSYNKDSYETSVPGLYVAGHLSRDLHMKNAILMASKIVHHVAGGGPLFKEPGFLAEKVTHTAKMLRHRSTIVRRLLKKYSPIRRAIQSLLAVNAVSQPQHD